MTIYKIIKNLKYNYKLMHLTLILIEFEEIN